MRERTKQAPTADDADNETADTICSSERGAVNAPSAPAGRDDSDLRGASTPNTDPSDVVDPPAVLS